MSLPVRRLPELKFEVLCLKDGRMESNQVFCYKGRTYWGVIDIEYNEEDYYYVKDELFDENDKHCQYHGMDRTFFDEHFRVLGAILSSQKPKKRFPEVPEIHMMGLLTVEKALKVGGGTADLGIQIGPDGRVWICIDGHAIIRFNPNKKVTHYFYTIPKYED